jgi:hypothetical protein
MKISVSIQKVEEDDFSRLILEDDIYTPFFKSKKHQLAYYFEMNSDGRFDKQLGVRKIHMVNLKKARELRRFYLSIFQSNKNPELDCDVNCSSVCANIEEMFRRVSGGKL